MESTTNNKVVLGGFAGADAEVKIISATQKLARVRLAVSDYYRTASGDEVKNTQWFNLVFWNAKADYAELNIKKGSRVQIEGRLTSNSYEGKDGAKLLYMMLM